MTRLSEYDEDTLTYLRAAGVGADLLNRVRASFELAEAKGAQGGVELMQQSASDLAFTNAQILASQQKTIQDLRALLFQIEEILDEATVIDRVTERRLNFPLGMVGIQRGLVEREEARP